MIRQGGAIEKLVTGKRVTCLKTAKNTNGAVVGIAPTVALGGFMATEHLYP